MFLLLSVITVASILFYAAVHIGRRHPPVCESCVSAEEDRNHLSRELHDEMGQLLTATSIQLERLRRDIENERLPSSLLIGDIQDLVKQAFECLRRFTSQQRLRVPGRSRLVPAMRQYTREFAERTGIEMRSRIDESVEQVTEEKREVVYRIMQECLTNVAKHAGATRVDFTIERRDGGLTIEVKDDGRSFGAKEGPDSELGGNGIRGMKERVMKVRGQFNMYSAPGEGTTVRVTVPLQEGGEADETTG